MTTWAASAQGAYPVGSAVAQPDLGAALPDPAQGLRNQSLRMILRPSMWSPRVRVRLSNVFGDRSLRLRGLRLGLHWGGGALVPGTAVALPDQEIAAGQSRWTPAVELSWLDAREVDRLRGRCLALSAWVDGASGPVTWHAKSMGTSYLSEPDDREAAGSDAEDGFVHTTTSTFFVDALDAWLPAGSGALVAFGDSLTDGTATTLNGQDRWTDVLQRRLWAEGRNDLAVVNAGIGGNQIAGPPASAGPWRGGPSALERMQRDVLGLSGLRAVFWLQGINDFSDNGNLDAAVVVAAVRTGVDRLRALGVPVIGATLPSALGGTRPGHGGALQDARRREFNAFVRGTDLFDRYADIDAVLSDPATGRLRGIFNGDSTLGESGDGVHPHRAGHAAMARCIRECLP
ncbi:MAG: GDSL-type esterase/lipase family protein [Burkholderiaceae bacterium]